MDKGYMPIRQDRSHLLKYLPKSQDELPKRTMQDSFLAGIIPLSKDANLQDKYVTFLGQVRMGRLLEDMDMFAGILKTLTKYWCYMFQSFFQLWLPINIF